MFSFIMGTIHVTYITILYKKKNLTCKDNKFYHKSKSSFSL